MTKAGSTEMEAVPIVAATNAGEPVVPVASLKVGMHVLGAASTDGRVMRAATALVQAGYTVTIVDIEKAECGQEREELHGVALKHVLVSSAFLSTRFKKWTLIRSARMFLRMTRSLLQTSADIYHAHDVSGLPATYIAAKLRRKPLIFDAHEMPLHEHPASALGRSRRVINKFLGVLLKYMIPRCAGVITVSPPIAREISTCYKLPKVTLVRNIPEYQDVQSTNRLRQALGLKPEARIALYQGYLQLSRGLDKLVYAAKFLEPGNVIIVMGKSVGNVQAELEALIAREGVADRIKIAPAVPYAELLEWTTSADVGLIIYEPAYSLNMRYALPNKFFEYLMAGLPVLITRLDAMVELVQSKDVGRVLPSLEPADVGEAINQMLADASGLARQRANARQVARNEFCWEQERAQLIGLYQEILEKRTAEKPL